MQCTHTATQLKASDRNSNRGRERERERQRERDRGCLHSMSSFLPSCLLGSERVALSTREQLVREVEGGGGTVSDQMPYYTLPFFPLHEYCLRLCTDSVLGHESCMSDGLCQTQKDKRDRFHLNHLWLIIDSAADVCESTLYCHKKPHLYLIQVFRSD